MFKRGLWLSTLTHTHTHTGQLMALKLLSNTGRGHILSFYSPTFFLSPLLRGARLAHQRTWPDVSCVVTPMGARTHMKGSQACSGLLCLPSGPGWGGGSRWGFSKPWGSAPPTSGHVEKLISSLTLNDRKKICVSTTGLDSLVAGMTPMFTYENCFCSVFCN